MKITECVTFNRSTKISKILVGVGILGLFSPNAQAATSNLYGLLNLGFSSPTTSFSTPEKLGAKYTYTPSVEQKAKGQTASSEIEDGVITQSLKSKAGFMAEAGAGYKFSPNLAVELAFQYHGYDLSGSSSATHTEGKYTEKGTGTLKSSLTNMSVLPKIRYNYDINDRIDVSVFAGAGLAYNITSDLADSVSWLDSDGATSKSTVTRKGASQIQFAWTSGVNAGYRITDTIKLGAFVNYNGLGSGAWNKVSTVTANNYISQNGSSVGATNTYNSAPKITLSSLDFGAGMRMSF